MMGLRGQALLMSSSACPLGSLLRRVSSSFSSGRNLCAVRPFVSFQSFRIAAPSSRTTLELRGTSMAVSRSRSRLCSVRAAHQVNDAGSIDSSMMQSMENKIKDQLSAETVIVKDAYGDGRHVSIFVVSSAFEGQSAVNRQRMVYKAIWEELQSTVHAVDQMITSTPAEANKTQ